MVHSVRRTEMGVWKNSATQVSSVKISLLLGWALCVDHVPVGTQDLEKTAQVGGHYSIIIHMN